MLASSGDAMPPLRRARMPSLNLPRLGHDARLEEGL